MKYPLVSIIIVTYNSEEYIDNCLKSVFQSIYSQFEVVIIDNNSTDTTRKILQKYKNKYSKKIQLLCNKDNLGYAQANNLGAELALGDYLFVLNPDTIVDTDFLLPLIKEMTNSTIAAVQPLVYLFDKKTINLTGKVTQYLGFDWLKDFKAIAVPKKCQIFSLSGSGILLQKKVFLSVGGFDEFYFTYYEDTDLSWKFNLIGKKIIFTPKSNLFHDYKYIPNEKQQSLKQKLFYIERNRIITILKNYSLKTLLFLFPIILFMELGMICFAFYEGWGVIKLKTYVSIIKNFSLIYKNRKFIQSARKVEDKDIIKTFESSISFEKFSNPIIRTIVNPVLELYITIASRII